MKSKSAQLKQTTAQMQKVGDNLDFLQFNKPFNFTSFYKTAAETSKILEKYKIDESTLNKGTSRNKLRSSKGEHAPQKNKKQNKQELVDVCQINIDASSLNSNRGTRPQPVNSETTPAVTNKGKVKSIMKSSSSGDQAMDPGSPRSGSSGKSKKRNKSVSFMLDDNEELVIKRTKSDESTEKAKSQVKDKQMAKKRKQLQQSEKDNKATEEAEKKSTSSTNFAGNPKTINVSEPVAGPSSSNVESCMFVEKKKKKIKRQKPESKLEFSETEVNNADMVTETKIKNKMNKKKHVKKTRETIESGDGDDESVPKSQNKEPKVSATKESGKGDTHKYEPASKSRKMKLGQDLVEDMESLSIGDNAHTLTSILDEMKVVDKDKKKKKKKQKGNKDESEKVEEVKEKVKWKKRKWNKDKKGDLTNENVDTTIVIENIPLTILLNYKAVLTDIFSSYGSIKKIGIAEVYPSQESRKVFTTSITFHSNEAAAQALEKDNSELSGGYIRIRRSLPSAATTLVVKSYAELTDANVSSAFSEFGKIRSIRHLVKGRRSIATSFVEFDGPEAVNRVTKKPGIKIGGKKVHVARYKPRSTKKKESKQRNDDSAAEADSEDSTFND